MASRVAQRGRRCAARISRGTAAARAPRTGRPGPAAASCVPSATMRPWSITTMRSALSTVARRCAMTSVVRPSISVLQRLLHGALALRVERAGGLVEQQDRRVLQQRARDRDALLLAAGQARAALAEFGVVALAAGRRGSRRRPRPRAAASTSRRWRRAGRSGCCRARWRRRSSAAAAPARWPRAARPGRASRTSMPSTRDRAGLRVVEAQQQREHGALAGAGRADQRDGLAGLHVQGEVAPAPARSGRCG